MKILLPVLFVCAAIISSPILADVKQKPNSQISNPQHGEQILGAESATASVVEYVDGPLAPLYDFLIQRRLQKFCKLLRDANLEQVIQDLGGSWTLFAPTDSSFLLLPGGTFEKLQRSPAMLRDFVLRHFVVGQLPLSQIQNEMLVDTVQGSPLRFNIYGQTVTVSGAQVLESDLPFELGLVHIIDHPLYPIPQIDILNYLRTSHKQMYRLVIDSGLADYISSGAFTFLAPDDQAFNYLSLDLKNALLNNQSLAQRVVLNHILPGVVYVSGIPDGLQWENSGGTSVDFTRRGIVLVNGVPIILPDVSVTNGVIHVINRVLLPEGVESDCQCKPSQEQPDNRQPFAPGSSRVPSGPTYPGSQGQPTTRRPFQQPGRGQTWPSGPGTSRTGNLPPEDNSLTGPVRGRPGQSQTTRYPQSTPTQTNRWANRQRTTPPRQSWRQPTTSRQQPGRTTPPVQRQTQPGAPATQAPFESNRQTPNCRRRSDRITPATQSLPLCPETGSEPCKMPPYDRSDPRPPCPGVEGECRNPGDSTYPGDRRPLCQQAPDCRDPNEPSTYPDNRPVCQDVKAECRKAGESPDSRPLCPGEVNCRPLLERPRPGDTRPVCSLSQTPKPNKIPQNGQRGNRYPTTRRPSWQTTLQGQQPGRQPSPPHSGRQPPGPSNGGRPSTPQSGSYPQQPPSGSYPSGQQPPSGSYPSQQTQSGTYPSQQPQSGSYPQPQQPQTSPGLPSSGSYPQTQQPQSGDYPQSGSYPQPQQPQAGSRPQHPQSGVQQPQYPQGPQSGRFPTQQPQSGSFPQTTPQRPSSYPQTQQPSSGSFPQTHPQQPQTGSFPHITQTGSQRPQSQSSHPQKGSNQPIPGSNRPSGSQTQSGSYPRQPSRPQTSSYPTRRPSVSYPSRPVSPGRQGSSDVNPEEIPDSFLSPGRPGSPGVDSGFPGSSQPTLPGRPGSSDVSPENLQDPSYPISPGRPGSSSPGSSRYPGSSQPTSSGRPGLPGTGSGRYPGSSHPISPERPGSPNTGFPGSSQPSSPGRPGSPGTGSGHYPGSSQPISPGRPGSPNTGFPGSSQPSSPGRPGSPGTGSGHYPGSSQPISPGRPGSPNTGFPGSSQPSPPGRPGSGRYPGSSQSTSPARPGSTGIDSGHHPGSSQPTSSGRPGSPGTGFPGSSQPSSSGRPGSPGTGFPGSSQPTTAGRPGSPGAVPGQFPGSSQPTSPGRPSNVGSGRYPSPQRQPLPGRGPSSPRIPISVTGTSTTPGEDSRRSLYEIVEEPALLIRGHPVRLTKIFELFHKAGIEDILSSPGPTTVFLPSDDAFAQLPQGVIEQLEEYPEMLRQVLLYHVTNAEILPSQQTTSFTVPSLQGNPLVVTMLNGGRLIMISGAKAIAVTRANNGIFYVINRLLYPLPQEDIVSAVRTRPDLSQFSNLLDQSGLSPMLQDQTPYTMFAPTDEAFSRFPPQFFDELARNTSALQEILLNHIIEGAHYGREFLTGGNFPSLRGGKLKVQVLSYGFTVNDANIKTPEIVTGTGIIHLIDQIILEPRDIQWLKSLGIDIEPSSNDQHQPSSRPQSGVDHPIGVQPQPGGNRTPINPPIVAGQHQSQGAPPRQPVNQPGRPTGSWNQNRATTNQPQRGRQPTTTGQSHGRRVPSPSYPQSGSQLLTGRYPSRIPEGNGRERPGVLPGPEIYPPTIFSQPGQPSPTGPAQTGNYPVAGQSQLGQPRPGQGPPSLPSQTSRYSTTSQPQSHRPSGGQSQFTRPSSIAQPQHQGQQPPSGSGPNAGQPQGASGQPADVTSLARAMGLNRFANWITNTGLLEKIHDGGVYTIFAPTDDAVNSLPNGMANSIDSNPEQTKALLQYHIIPQRLNFKSIGNEETSSTLLQGKKIRFNVYQNGNSDCKQVITASGTPLGQSLGTVGSVHVIPIDQVLYQPTGNLQKIIEASPILQNLAEAIKNARISWILSGTGPMTFFAPSDAAFQALSNEERKNLIENKQAFTDLLKRHITRGTIFSSGVQQDIQKKSENGKPMSLTLQEGILVVNSIPVVYSDITATNGVLHVIDKFL